MLFLLMVKRTCIELNFLNTLIYEKFALKKGLINCTTVKKLV
jgi:hypothetical protein